MKMKPLHRSFGLTVNVSVFSEADAGRSLCSDPGPGIGDGQNTYSPAGQDRRSPDPAAHLTYEGHDDRTH